MGSSKHLDNGILSFIKWLAYSVSRWMWSMIVYTISYVWASIFFLILYINDIFLASNNIGLLHDTKRFLIKTFDIKDHSEAFFVLNM